MFHSKQRVRIFLRPEALKYASQYSVQKNISLSESIEDCLRQHKKQQERQDNAYKKKRGNFKSTHHL